MHIVRSTIAGAVVVTVAAVCLLSESAEARSPRCSSGAAFSGYRSGYSTQKNLLEQIWRSNYHRDCTNLERFVRAIDVPFNPHSISPSLACRNEGIAEATQEVISDVTEECANECAQNGADIGALRGRIFCNVTRYYAPLAQPLKLCSFAARQACTTSLDGYVADNCPGSRDEDPARYASYLATACVF
jgi:hypothetical protein